VVTSQAPGVQDLSARRGTHTGPFLGTPATGRRAEWVGIGIYTVRDGKITEAWFGEDILGMLFQLGAITLPA
jgi:predicted ester cyclase